jgi:anti-sigma regulatory factor (Ser/Thr protein kinase)/GAF domain-containing protein
VTVEPKPERRQSVDWRVTRLIGLTLLGATVAGASFAATQYRAARETVHADAARSVLGTAQAVDQIVVGRIKTLVLISANREFRNADRQAIKDHFDSLVGRRQLERDALGWVDTRGRFSVSADFNLKATPINVSDREYFRKVKATSQPFVSGGIRSRLNKTPVFVIAVPTFDDNKELNGVLTWAIRLDELDTELHSVVAGTGTVVLDRSGAVVFGPKDIVLRSADARFDFRAARLSENRLLTDATSPTGATHQLIAQSHASSVDWVVLRSASAAEAYGPARKVLFVELALLGLAATTLTAFGSRTQRKLTQIQLDQQISAARSESLRLLATELTSATSQADVTEVLTRSGPLAVGAMITNVAAPGGYRPTGVDVDIPMAVASTVPAEVSKEWTVLPADAKTPMRDAFLKRSPVLIRTPAELAIRYPLLAGPSQQANVRASASFPLFDAQENVVGAIGFAWAVPQLFDESQVTMLDTASHLAAQALERAALFDREQSARVRAETMQRFAADLVVANSVGAVMDAITTHAIHVLSVDSATVSPAPIPQPKTTETALGAVTKRGIAVALPVEAFDPSMLVVSATEHFQPDSSALDDFILRGARALDREHRTEVTNLAAERARKLAATLGQFAAASTREEVTAAFARSLSSFALRGALLGLLDEQEAVVNVLHESDFGPLAASGSGERDRIIVPGDRLQIDRSAINQLATGLGQFQTVYDSAILPGEPIGASIMKRFSEPISSWAVLALTNGGRTIGLIAFVFATPQSFDDEQRVELSSYAALCANALARAERFEREHEIAVTLQASLLPHVPHQIGDAHLAGRYRPSTRNISVGGDWFDAIALPDGRYLLVVGDVVGHGIHSAAAMGKLSTATRTLAPLFPEPSELLQQLDKFAETDRDTRYASLAVVLVDPFGGKVSVSLAGHPAPVMASNQNESYELIAGRGPALGVAGFKRTQLDTAVDESSIIIMYTDGLTERRNEHVTTRTQTLISSIDRSTESINELADELLREMLDEDQSDDVAVLVANNLVARPRFLWTLPSQLASLSPFRHELRDQLEQFGAHGDEIEDILVAVGEAVTNAIEHGSRRTADATVQIVASRAADLCAVVVADSGPRESRTDDPGPRRDRGRGLVIMQKLMDDVRIDRYNAGTVVTLTKALHRRMDA